MRINVQLPTRDSQRARLRTAVGRVLAFGSWGLVVGSLLSGISGCAKAQAASAPGGTPLAVPAPPPRVITPVEEVAAAPAPPASPEPAAAAPKSPTAARTPGRTDAPRTDPKPEPPAVVAQPAPVTPSPAAAEPREVRAEPSTSAAAEERKV